VDRENVPFNKCCSSCKNRDKAKKVPEVVLQTTIKAVWKVIAMIEAKNDFKKMGKVSPSDVYNSPLKLFETLDRVFLVSNKLACGSGLFWNGGTKLGHKDFVQYLVKRVIKRGLQLGWFALDFPSSGKETSTSTNMYIVSPVEDSQKSILPTCFEDLGSLGLWV
jgi:hypothetical protein